tara:strand:- start:284 stop:670 length:387 start_codon:yes stop_codon:yes gene_type:complete
MKYLITSLLILVSAPAFAQDEATLFPDTMYNMWSHDYAAVYNTPLHARYVLVGEESMSLIPDSIHLSVMPENEWASYAKRIVNDEGEEVDEEYVISNDRRHIMIADDRDPDTDGLVIVTLFGSEEEEE